MPNNKLFVRFGVWVRNQSGQTGGARGGSFMLDVIPRTGASDNTAGGPTLCMSGGASRAPIDTPVTPAISSEDVVKFRPTVDLHANTGVELILVQFESDDGINWPTEGVPLEATHPSAPVTPKVYAAEPVNVNETRRVHIL